MKDFIAIAAIIVILGLAIGYIIKKKKSGVKCIGCPDSCSCAAKKDGSSCGCGSLEK